MNLIRIFNLVLLKILAQTPRVQMLSLQSHLGYQVVPMPSPARPPALSEGRMWLVAHHLVPYLVVAEEGGCPQAGGVLEAAGSLQHPSM